MGYKNNFVIQNLLPKFDLHLWGRALYIYDIMFKIPDSLGVFWVSRTKYARMPFFWRTVYNENFYKLGFNKLVIWMDRRWADPYFYLSIMFKGLSREIRGTLKNCFTSYLSNRQQHVSVLGFDSENQNINHEVPQQGRS